MILQEGQTLLGWRDVPVDLCDLGKTAVESMPFPQTGIYPKIPPLLMPWIFERKLYTIRKQVKKITRKNKPPLFLCGQLFFPYCCLQRDAD